MKALKAGIIGTGYIGPVHIEALRRLGSVDVVAVAEVNEDLARIKADQLNIPKGYGNYKDMLADESIDIIHNCTPNHLHYQVNVDILNAGKHCVSEKPLGMTSTEAKELVDLAKKNGVINAVNFNYRYYPIVQQVAAMVHQGALGKVFSVQGGYMQDWLLYDTDWNWRLEPQLAGESRAMGDIGSHWFDLMRFILNKKITRVMADLMIVHEVRKKPKIQVETFSGKTLKPSDYEEVKITTEEHGHVLLEFEDGTRGMTCVSQVAAGRKNHITFELQGTESSVWWDHERPNELMTGHRNEPNELQLKDPSMMNDSISDYAHYPAGHNEGYPSCVKNFCRNVYRYIEDSKRAIDFATFEDGYNANCVVDATLQSHQLKKWVDVEY